LRKARLFIHRAWQKSEQSLDETACAHIHNLLGNLDLDEGKYPEAAREYENALNLCGVAPRRDPFLLGIVKENLGYCRVLQGEFRHGIRLLQQAAKLSETAGDHRGVAEARQDIAFAHLQHGRWRRGLEPAREALRLAEVWNFRDIVKNCLFLLGEIHLRLGSDDWSDYYFTRLQRFYPEVPFLRPFLRGCDIVGLITMKNPPMERSSF
jgi:tetratricopeptide (TPR) repeat protein